MQNQPNQSDTQPKRKRDAAYRQREREAARRRYWADPEKYRTRTQQWRLDNPETAKATDRRYYEKTRPPKRPKKSEEQKKLEARERTRLWVLANRERKQETDRRYREREEIKERKRENDRKYYQANRERIKAWQKEYTAKNAERIRKRVREWAKANPERARTNSRATQAQRRARKLDAAVEHVDPLKVFERDSWRCQICGCDTREAKWPDPNSATLDHIVPLSRGGIHSYANTQCLCNRCNRLKGAA